jgi:hypothetical protein
MVAISQALETAIAIIIFIVLAMMFFSVFGSTECDKLSNTTAIELTNAINKVALEYGIEPWTGGNVPEDAKTNNYVTVPIRLCEKNMMNAFAAQFEAQQPTYILTYEIFPEEGFAWSESQPFSGGAAESVLNYAVMKYGIQGITLAGKFVTKILKTVFKGGFSLIGIKIAKFLDEAKNNKVIGWFLSKFGSSAAQEPIEETLDDTLNGKYYKSKWKGLIEKIKGFIVNDDLDEEEALVKAKVYKEGPDGLALLTLDGKKVVNTESRDFILNFIENKGEEAEDFAKGVYIPPRFPWLSNPIERIKANYWQPLKNRVRTWWQNRMIKKYLYDKPKEIYDYIRGKVKGAKSAFNEIFNYKDGMTDAEIVPEEFGIVAGIAKENSEETLQAVKNNFDVIKDELERVTGETFTSPEQVTTKHLIQLFEAEERYGSMSDLIGFMNREIENTKITSIAMKDLGSDLRRLAKEVNDGTVLYEDFVNVGGEWSMANYWGDLPQTQKDKWVERLSKGYTVGGQPLKMAEEDVKKVYEYTRMSMANEGLFDRTIMFANGGTGSLRVNQLVTKAERVERELISSSYKIGPNSADRIIGFISMPQITNPSALSKIPREAKIATSLAYKKLKNGVFLDLNRIGQGPLAPYNILLSPYDVKQALKKESQKQEGGCASQSICKLQRGKAEGPTETATAYLLDRKVSSSISVKLWRPKPDLWSRTPTGINTALFYNSIWENPRFYVASPCFATAKVWKDKSKNTVFISIDKGKKCDVSGCKQPASYTFDLDVKSLNIPYLNRKTPSHNFGAVTVGLNSIDTPNYCYASEEFIWGQDTTGKGNTITTGDAPSEYLYYGIFGGCIAGCSIASSLATWGAAIKSCLKGCGYLATGILIANTIGATQLYRDVPSSERQETSWGYWNYQKATDICDNIQMVASFGTSIKLEGKKLLQKFKSFNKLSVGKQLRFVGGKLFGVGDLCYGLQLIGDTSLSWPIKTPVGEFWKKSTTLDDKCMQESAAKCVWLEKCDPSGQDPSLITCPDRYMCDPEEKICKKTGIT